MTIGVVSLWHNHPELLPFFTHMMRVDGWDKLVVVDNASDEGLAPAYKSVLGNSARRTHVIRMAKNNVVDGWNTGVTELDTDIVIVLANDLLMLDARWVRIAAEGMQPGIFQGPYPFVSLGQHYLDGSFTVWMREDWEKLGGLDEGYQHPGYYSDVDICYRAMQAGMEMRHVPVPVHHLRSWTAGAILDDPATRNATQNNQARFISKRGY